jgi:sirohydrochlorin ferrochelatase
VPDRTAPVLVGCSHGTDSVAGRAAIRSVLDGVRRAHPALDVREAFVDVQQPEVADVVGGALADVGEAVVVPLLLSAGYHVHVDIAEAVAPPGAAASGALGPDRRLADILFDRLADAGAGPGDTVVLAAAGSTDARAADAVEEVARQVREVWRHGPVVIGYGAGAQPSVPVAVAAARADGARRVVIASYLLAPGFFHDRLLAAGADVVTAPLAPDDRLVPVVVDRFRAAADRMARGSVLAAQV